MTWSPSQEIIVVISLMCALPWRFYCDRRKMPGGNIPTAYDRCLLIVLINFTVSLFVPELMPTATIRYNSSINVFLVLRLILSSILDNASVLRPQSSGRADRGRWSERSCPSSWPSTFVRPLSHWIIDDRLSDACRVLSISFRCLRQRPRATCDDMGGGLTVPICGQSRRDAASALNTTRL